MPLLFCLLGLSSFVVFLSRVVTSSSAVAERPRDALCPSVKYLEGSVLLLRHQLRTIKRCSVVFGVMLSQVKSSSLMLLVTNTSSSSTAVNKLRRLQTTSVINSPWFVTAGCVALAAHVCHLSLVYTMEPDIDSES